jgi:hypothetical protein
VATTKDKATGEGGLAASMDAMMSGRPAAGAAPGGGLNLGGLDLSKVGDGNLIPQDEWVDSEVVSAVSQKATTGNNMIVLQLKTVAPGQYAGAQMYDNLVLSDAALWKFKSAAKACGLLSADGASFLGRDERDFVGKVLRHQVKVDEYDGRERNKVKGGYKAPTGEYGGQADGDSNPF